MINEKVRRVGMIKLTVGIEGMACGMCEAHISGSEDSGGHGGFPVQEVR